MGMTAVQSLTPESIRAGLRLALEAEAPLGRRRAIADFIDAVDWTNADTQPVSDEVRMLLGTISRALIELEENDIDEGEFMAVIRDIVGTRRLSFGAVLQGTTPGLSNTVTTSVAIDTRTNRTERLVIIGEV